MSEKLRQIVADGLVVDLHRFVDAVWDSAPFQAMGSEIERAFAASMIVSAQLNQKYEVRLARDDKPFVGWFLEPQGEIGNYRVDFLFGRGDQPELGDCVVVECDGHDFHDRTPEQAARDKARDRFLNLHVKAVLRFTGREIYRDVSGCCIEALNVLHREQMK